MLDGVQQDSYCDAYFSLGLVEDYKEYIEGIIDASQRSSANSLRNLFATLLSFDTLELVLSDDEVRNLALTEVEKILRRRGTSLCEYETMPFPNLDRNEASTNILVMDE
ncbi:ATP-dependent Clp protease ATP-binding subunit ClpX [Striga asiatica]|uniref:ATP-dependent Clp protease ATP-binding subunit ClpX n=1 Tax=Striga asiatica TaxID=4170 RepID=A0A5A7QL89_STRAF|nr:ATP-dependent Clp protease ATP-binding subunit ClpX [Striga asiatica]